MFEKRVPDQTFSAPIPDITAENGMLSERANY